jgi:hypothetical protein
MPDFTSYVPPGTYIEEDPVAAISVVGLTPTVLAIVGPSIGYRTATEAVTLVGTTSVTLSNLGIDQDTIVVRSVSGTVYVATTDYVAVEGNGADDDIDTTEDNETTLHRSGSGSAIDSGEVVYVSYQYTDLAFYDPLRTTDLDDIQTQFGPAINAETGIITSPLSFAAKLALENGARDLVVVASAGSASTVTRQELSNALDKLEAIFEVNMVVVLPVGVTGTDLAAGDTSNIATDLEAHCIAMEAEGNRRIGVIGYGAGVTRSPQSIANDVSSSRVILAWPNRVIWYNGFTNTSTEVSGIYLAAAMAGRIASLAPQMPLTMKPIRGFTGFPASTLGAMTRSAMNTWSNGGVSVVEQQVRSGSSRLFVRHGVTTDGSSAQKKEISLVRARDTIMDVMVRTIEEAGLIGTPITVDTKVQIKSVMSGGLETLKSAGVLVDWDELRLRQRAEDASIVDVKFRYLPAFPLNYIAITFSINTATGAVINESF